MSKYALSVLTALAVLSLMTSLHSARAEDGVKSTMKKNFNALMNLQPYVADPQAFSDPKNRNDIQKNLDAMSSLDHVFPNKMTDQEPGLAAVSSLFSEYLTNTRNAFKAGASGHFIRNQVRTITSFCLSCHTRVGTNLTFKDIEKKVDSAALSQFQKAEFYAATRQFDKAIEQFDKILSATPNGELGYIELGRSVRQALSLTIRVKQDPKATYGFLHTLSLRQDLPEFFQRCISQWKSDASKWMQEKKRPSQMTTAELMSKAKSLVAQAQARQLYPVDPSGDLNYLRATNYLHEALQKEPKGKFRGEALYLLGNCYDALQDPMLWSLDSLYFEACVRENPHTPVSKKCFQRYASKLYFSYSGSGGTFVPEDELKKLSELRKLAN